MDFEVSLSVVVPVYNSEASLPLLIERLDPVLTAHARNFEAILVNDGSRDRSWDVISQLKHRYPWVRGISLTRNYGQHNALLCGIRAARNEVIVTLDDDLQNPPEEIPKLLGKLAEGYDVVYGAPEEERHGLWRDLASCVTKTALQSAVGAETARHASAFRAFRTEARGGFANFQGPFVSIDVLLTWGASRFAAVPVQHDERRLGASQYTLRKLVRHAFNMMTGFSVLPLQIASLVGFVFTAFGFLVLVYVIGGYLIRGGSVPGFPFLASLIAMFSGVQMFALGIIGEYLARMHFRMMDRPSYAIRQQTVQAERAAPRLVAGMHA
jgi:undecaprenyl-phosphate 4-deoxy-4-formamido-L-arabinose transferase